MRPGAIVLVEDMFGRGHISRHPEEGQCVMFVPVPDGLAVPSPWLRCNGDCLCGVRVGKTTAQERTSTAVVSAHSRVEQGLAPDCLQPSLLRRSGFRQQVKPSVRRTEHVAQSKTMTRTLTVGMRLTIVLGIMFCAAPDPVQARTSSDSRSRALSRQHSAAPARAASRDL